MTDRSASFSFSFSDGTLNIEGSELFVTQQVDAFKEHILSALERAAEGPAVIRQLPSPSQDAPITPQPPRSGDAQNDSIKAQNQFPRVLDEMNGKLKVTASIKGKNTAERAINLILAYLWGKENLLNEPTAEYKELRDLCAEHACLDSSNFSSTLTSKKHLILIDGTKGSSSKLCKLTYPGREEAKEVLKMLSGE